MNRDCFGFTLSKCTALTEMLCKDGRHCPFYKTKEQFAEDAEKARKINEKKNMRSDF